MLDKPGRLAEANRVLEVISSHGRRFFHHEGFVAHFELDEANRIWFIDSYTRERVWMTKTGRWSGFSNGSTLRGLCDALRGYIRTGEPIQAGYFGPWRREFCDGDLWGYGDNAMEAVRRGVLATEAVRAC